jgi:hypothetical protein
MLGVKVPTPTLQIGDIMQKTVGVKFGQTFGGSGQGGFGESGESSVSNVEDLVFERGIDVRHETVRFRAPIRADIRG